MTSHSPIHVEVRQKPRSTLQAARVQAAVLDYLQRVPELARVYTDTTITSK